MFNVSSIINNFQLVNTMNALLALNEHIVNAILFENENYNIHDKHLTNSNSKMRCEM